MEESSPTKKATSSSRVIDSLHSQIDKLKEELEQVRISSDDYKKKYAVSSKKNELFVDQLANAKHENDMINALLKRKERRISDLEDQYNELSLSNESLMLAKKNLKIRCDNLQESSASSTAEYERLKIAYDALIASQVEYKRHYQKEINSLTAELGNYKKESTARFEELKLKLANNDRDSETLLDSLTNKRKTLDSLYVSKNKTVLDLLSALAKSAKAHGQESKAVLQDNVKAIGALTEKYPDLQEKLTTHEKTELDLDTLLSECNDTLSNSSFDDEVTLINSSEEKENLQASFNSASMKNLSRSNTLQSKKRKNKRNSMRIDSKNLSDLSNINTPTSQLHLPKRSSTGKNLVDSKPRTPTPPRNDFYQPNSSSNTSSRNSSYNNAQINVNNIDSSVANNHNSGNNQKNNNKQKNSNRAKRRSMYGGNNHGKRNSQIIDNVNLVLN